MLTSFRFHFHYDTTVHLKKTTVGIPGEFCITSLLGERFDHFIIDSQIEDGVHHARHRLTSAGADGKKERILKITKLFPHGSFDLGDIRFDLGIKSLGILLTVVVIVSANFGRDGEPCGNGNSDTAHFGEICALAPKKSLH